MKKLTLKKAEVTIDVLVTQLNETQTLLAQIVNWPGNEANGGAAARQFKWNQMFLDAVKEARGK